MNFFTDSETFISLGNVSIKWYTITLIIGVVLGYLHFSRHMKEHGYKQKMIDEMYVLGIVGGLLIGRAGWVLENLKNYSLYAWYVFAFNDGGVEVIMSLFGMGLFNYHYTKKHNMSFFRSMDIATTSLLIVMMVAQIGRCFSYPKTWISVLLCWMGFHIIWFFYRPYKPGHKRGDMTAVGLLWLGTVRLIAHVFKLDVLADNCLIMCFFAEIGGILLYLRNRNYIAPKPVILFDLDGTLLDSEAMVIHCFMHLFEKYGNPEDFTHEKQLEVFGPPLKDEMEKLFPNRDPEVMVQEYRLYQNSLPGKGIVKLLPNTEIVLKELKSRGYTLGIVSSRLTESCEMWLKEFNILDMFDIVLGRDMVIRPKPAPDGILKACELMNHGHDSVIYVGDNVSDVKAGKNAGVYTVAYISNKEKMDKIRKAEPNYVIFELGDLMNVLQDDHAWTYEQI